MALNGISTLMIASGTTLTKNANPPHSNTEIVAPFSAIWSINYAGALGATNNVSYKLYVTSLGIGSAFTLTSHQTGDYAVTAGNFLYDEYGTSIAIIKGNTTIDNYMAKAAAVCSSVTNPYVGAVMNAVVYKGTWNAFSNTPTLTHGIGTDGDAYDVTVAGTSLTTGSDPAYDEQDWIIYAAGFWWRVAKTTTTEWTIAPAGDGLADKEARQNTKLTIAEAKRKGKTVAGDGTISGFVDSTRSYYRQANILDKTLLPTVYTGATLTTQSHPSGLVDGRPWVEVPPVPTYAVAATRSVMNEGEAATFTISTSLVSDGTTLYWGSLSDNLTNSSNNRLSPGYTGSLTINNNTASLTITVSADSADQNGVQKLRIGLYTDSSRNTLVATSTPDVTVTDTSVFTYFEQQLVGGTYMTFDQTISTYRVQSVVTNFNGNPINGSYIKVNGALIAGDKIGLAPDGTDTRLAPFRMTRGHTITIINPVTGTSRSGFPKCYDTYGGAGLAASPTAGIANDIKNAATGDIIVMGTYDATSCSQAMRDALTNYCGDTAYTNTWASIRTSHMFLGKRNSTP